ncbi:DUF885 domain-containing protein [Nocardioides sp. GXQ0305]|uniref:DUF885 domain-containing protein n=1 Tax=Nocardioides sp. GXQ0305 TaxID=3423912 RepID=UPI003D7E6B24
MTADPAARPVDVASDRYVADFCALDPITATFVGVGGHDHELTDLSPDGFEAREELSRRALAEVTAAEPTDEREVVAREAFLERVGLEMEIVDAGLARSQVSVIGSGLHAVRQVFDLMPTETEEDWANVDARLAAVPRALAGYCATLRDEAGRGRVSAARQFRQVVHQVGQWVGRTGDAGDILGTLARRCDVARLRPELERHAARANEALEETARVMEQEILPLAPERDAVGRDHYALYSRYFLGAEVDLEQTYAWGWTELKRLADDLEATADRILPGASYAEAVAHLEADPARVVHGRDAFRGWMQDLADQTIDQLAAVHFDIPEPVRRIECMLAPTHDGGIYYTGPSEDFSRPGRMWWAVPDGIEDFHPWLETSTVYHEGVPGHHLQVGQTAYRSEVLNRWQRLLCWVSGHGEGWALYAERLMDDLGHLADPADRLGMLDQQSLRAARVVVDIGMHLELEIPADNPFGFHPGERWDAGLGLEFMNQHSRMDAEVIAFEVDRYLGWPGQAPSYKVGERIWLEARDQARSRAEAAGGTFDLRTFHRQALDLGALGLDPLQRALARL